MTDYKPWYKSRAIWGAVLALLAPIFGLAGISIDISTGDFHGNIYQLAGVLAGPLGAVAALWGRLVARARLMK